MFKLALALLVLFACAVVAPAQNVSNIYLAGGSYSEGASPAFAASLFYAHQVSPDTAPGTYAFTSVDVLPNGTKPGTVTTNVAVGVAQRIATIAGVPIFAPTSAGISLNGTNAGWAWATGVGAPFKLKASADGGGWYVMPTIRVLKSSVSGGTGYQPIFGLQFGWGK